MDNRTFESGSSQNIPGTQRSQIAYPLDPQSEGSLKLALDNVLKDVIIRRNRIQYTIPSGATSFDVASSYMVLTAAAGVTIATIKGGREGMILTLQFTNANVTITDTGTGAADTVNLSTAFTSSANAVLQLLQDGTSWREISRGDSTGLFVAKGGDTMTGDLNVPDEAYGSGWNGSTEVPTKNALYDKIETLGTTLKMLIPTSFETSGRFTLAVSGGTNTFGVDGLTQTSTVTSTRYASAQLTYEGGAVFAGSPTFSVALRCQATPGSNNPTAFFGIGSVTVAGTGHTFTDTHIGFKIVMTGGAQNLHATQADGTTENASASLTTVVSGDTLDLICKVNSTTSVDYYWRKNGGSLSSATNLTSNLPTASDDVAMQFSVSNNSTAATISFAYKGAKYER